MNTFERIARFLLASAPLFVSVNAHALEVAIRANRPATVGKEVAFAAVAAGQGEIEFHWDFGDGATQTSTESGEARHTYGKAGHYPIIVRAEDDAGSRTASYVQTIYVPAAEGQAKNSSTIALSPDESRVCVVNVDNASVSCVNSETHQLLFETPCEGKPRGLAFSPDGSLWVVHESPALLVHYDSSGQEQGRIELPQGSRPLGVVVDSRGASAWVSLQGANQVVRLDLASLEVLSTAPVARTPTGLALSPDEKRLLVSHFISPDEAGLVSELSAAELGLVRVISLAIDVGPDSDANSRGLPNYLRQVIISPDGGSAWIPSKKDNIERGIFRDGKALTFETAVRSIASFVDLATGKERLERRLDINNRGMPMSATLSPRGDYLFVATLGTNTIEVIDAYDSRLRAGIEEIGFAPDGLLVGPGDKLFVHGFLSRSIVIVDIAGVLSSSSFTMNVLDEVTVVKEEKLSADVLFGKRLFYNSSDARLAHDGYVSCAACHFDGFEDGRVWDFGDRGEGLRNTISLLGRAGTGHGPLHWSANFDEVQDFEHDIRGPFAGTGLLSDEIFLADGHDSSLGTSKAGLSEELDALAAYVTSLDEIHHSPHRAEDGLLTAEGMAGRELFLELACQDCHSGDTFTDSKMGVRHDVGTLTPLSGQRLGGELNGLDTPTLLGVWETAPYLHDGSAESLPEVFAKRNEGELHGATHQLNEAQLGALVSYLQQIDGREEKLSELGAAVEPEQGPAVSTAACSFGWVGASSQRFRWTLLLVVSAAFARRRRQPRRETRAGV